MILILVLVPACGTGTESGPEPEAGFKPILLPVKFTFSSSGISVRGDKSLIVPIGVFSVGAKYSLPHKEADAIYVTIRDRKEPPLGFDHTYKVRSGRGEFTAVVNGTTTIQIKNRHVLVDVTDARVQTIEFKTVQPAAAPEQDNIYGKRWHSFWRSAFYKPFAMSRWAYDDSTISKWYGLGFAWFLIRLLLTLIILIPDLILTTVVVLAGVADMLLGATARNIVYGLSALVGLMFLGATSLAVVDSR
jgi:hypothetical protein